MSGVYKLTESEQYDVQCVGAGWQPIVQSLIERLRYALWTGEVQQVKEKFGGLRFYANALTAEHYQMVREAEGLCAITCEECGMPGSKRDTSWIKTLCDKHYEEVISRYETRPA